MAEGVLLGPDSGFSDSDRMAGLFLADLPSGVGRLLVCVCLLDWPIRGFGLGLLFPISLELEVVGFALSLVRPGVLSE